MHYLICSIHLNTEMELPQNYSAFSCNSAPEKKNTEENAITLVRVTQKPDFSDAVKTAELSLMIVWKTADSWIFESAEQKGCLTVSRDYSKGEFFCDPVADSDPTIVLQPLLQAMLECRLIWEGFGILHASCVCLDAKAIAFSAPSGTGKSERASGFVKYLGASWVSGDRPAIEPVQGKAFGVPWDGKEQIFVNASAPIQAIVEVRRGGSVLVREMTRKQKMQFLSTQLMIPMWDTVLTQKVFTVLQQMISHIPMYRLYCDISEQSIRQTYEMLFLHPEKRKKESVENTMKLKADFDIIEVAGDYMAVPTGENMTQYGGAVVLNEVSACLLRAMKNPVTEEELLELLLNTYEVEQETAAGDLKKILHTFEELGLIEE